MLIKPPEALGRKCSAYKLFCKIHAKPLVPESLYSKVANRYVTLLKRYCDTDVSLWISQNFKNSFFKEHLHWLLLKLVYNAETWGSQRKKLLSKIFFPSKEKVSYTYPEKQFLEIWMEKPIFHQSKKFLILIQKNNK